MCERSLAPDDFCIRASLGSLIPQDRHYAGWGRNLIHQLIARIMRHVGYRKASSDLYTILFDILLVTMRFNLHILK